MGSGARAYRMAVGQQAAMLESELSLIEAGEEDVSDIFLQQQQAISGVLEDISKMDQGGPVYYNPPKMAPRQFNYTLIAIVIIVILLWLS